MPKSTFQLPKNLVWPLVVLLIALAAFYFKPWQVKPAETISVTASGKSQVTPNVAKISASIQSTNPNLDKAREENNQKVSALVQKLKDMGIDEKDIKTQDLSAGPGYEPQIQIFPAPDRPDTNQMTTTLEITVRDFDASDEVIAALTSGGATNLYGPNLTVDDKTLESAQSKAREDAVEEAREKAEELAKLSGRRLGKVAKISEQGDFGYPQPLLARSEVDLKQQASQIQPGQNEVTINLAVEFGLR
ncbi:MAG: SIMPL domain-containing protein [Candidatus Curtissbacteria bacterium]